MIAASAAGRSVASCPASSAIPAALIRPPSRVIISLPCSSMTEERGASVEVIDLRCTVPLDIDTVVESVKKTGRLVVAHEAHRRLGVGAEIAALVQELAFDYLDAPVERVGALDIPTPYSKPLEDEALPDAAKIVQAIKRVTYSET